MREYRHPERVTEGQLLWLELEEFPDRPRIVVRVFSVMGLRVEVYALGGDDTPFWVDRARLFEEVPQMSDTIDLAALSVAAMKLQRGGEIPAFRRDPPLWSGPFRIVVDDRVPIEKAPRSLTRWERIREWFERLVDRAELTPEVFPWPRVQRTTARPAAYLLLGRDLYVHPIHLEALLQQAHVVTQEEAPQWAAEKV